MEWPMRKSALSKCSYTSLLKYYYCVKLDRVELETLGSLTNWEVFDTQTIKSCSKKIMLGVN